MKLNGKNIILDSDVTVTESSSSLSEVLKSHSNDLEKLKSNVKWLYKYGGVGSGSGSGGGSSTSKWYALINVNGISYQVNSEETKTGNLIVNGSGKYPISVQIIRPQGSAFSISVSYFNGTNTTKFNSILDVNNAWTISEDILLGGNSTISVTITDGEYTAIMNIDYISTPYIFKFELCNEDGSQIYNNDSDVFINDIGKSGLKAKLTYDIGVDVEEDTEGNKVGITYTIVDILGNSSDKKVLDLSQGNTGYVLFDLVDDFNFLLNDDNAASYTYYLNLSIVTKDGGISSQENYQLSFNLIPSNLYLKIVPDTGTIYKTEQSDPQYIYYTGPKSFSITPFFGNNQGRMVTVYAKVDNISLEDSTTIQILERQTLSGFLLTITNTGEELIQAHKIEFVAICGNITNTFTYYLYAQNVNSNLNWYPIDNKNTLYPPTVSSYWKGPNFPGNTINLTSGYAYQMTNSMDSYIIDTNIQNNNPKDMLFAVGIMYSEINDHSNTPILSLCCKDNTSSDAYINIYYNKVVLGSSVENINTQVECYINKTSYDNYNLSESNLTDKWHLIQIYKRLVKQTDSNTRYYELMVYIDGVIEACFQNLRNIELLYNQIQLHPGNYYINLLELSYFDHTLSTYKYDYLTDANIVRYWYTYRALKLTDTTLNVSLLTTFENNVQLTNTTSLPVVNSGLIEDIAQNANIPVIKFSYEENNLEEDFLTWFGTNYQENSIIPSKQVKVFYSSGNSNSLTEIETKDCQFWIDVQGSTTRSYYSKNLELSIKATSASDEKTYLFSPNFSNTDTNTYLPESSFTLKADVVDSSHSNNTTMGDFINKNTTKFADAKQTTTYGKYIKNCLIGYPVLAFIEIKNQNTTTIYYLGIYNFNLGRKSFFNLGYIDTNILNNVTNVISKETGLSEGFHIYAAENVQKLPNFIAAEITGNDNRFDFSQFDTSILFRDNNNPNDQYAMFDDIETNLTYNEYSPIIQNMVKGVAKAGHFIFSQLQKNFGDYEYGYNAITEEGTSKNQVPDYRTQYTRIADNNGNKFFAKEQTEPDGTGNDLNSLINANLDTTNLLDYTSLIEYYTICMIFGLFDSVQKNLNIKTWTKNGRFYVAFYDMDTCLGVLNDGTNANYFAFSDYWNSTYTTLQDTVIGKDGKEYTRTLYQPSNISIYRDFSPANNAGFDVPSSYLFAIAKYTKIFNQYIQDKNQQIDEQLNFPQQIWADWRKVNGVLCNAENFIEKYYKHHLDNVNELMFNYNYRAKYLILEDLQFDNVNYIKFKGRRLEYVRQWLDGRFHLLDAYFNMPRANNYITKYNLETKQWENVGNLQEPIIQNSADNTNNEDIYVIHSIFGDQARFQGNIEFIVKSQDFSPIFITSSGGNPEKMLLTDKLVDIHDYYRIYSNRTGNNAINIGGSSLWTELDNINCFNTSCSINSKLLTTLNGTEGSISNWIINMPSIRTLSLTSSEYSGELILGEECADLTEIDVSNSKLNVQLNSLKSLTKVTSSNSNGVSLNITNCNNINELNLSGKFGSIFLGEVPNSLTLNGLKTTSLNLTTSKGVDIKITNDTTVTAITLSGFQNIIIENCPKLKTVTISNHPKTISITNDNANSTLKSVDLDLSTLTTLDLSNNLNLNSITVYNIDNTPLSTLNISKTGISNIINDSLDNTLLDVSKFNELTTFNIQNNTKVQEIQFTNDKVFHIKKTFTGCTNLLRVYGNLSIDIKGCFSGLSQFSIHGSDLSTVTFKGNSVLSGKRIIPVYELFGDNNNSQDNDLFQSGSKVTNITFGITDVSNTFDGTNCTIFDLYYTLCNLGSAKILQSLFANLKNINYGVFNYENSPNLYIFNKATNVTSISFIMDQRANLDTKKIRLFAGLFNPLVNLTELSGPFYGYSYIIDENIFKDSNFSKLTTISYFYPKFILDDVDNFEEYPSSITLEMAQNIDNYGHVRSLFNSNMTSLKYLKGFVQNTAYIDYSGLKIPSTVVEIHKSFISTYGTGTIDMLEIFPSGSKLEHLSGSFVCQQKLDIDVSLFKLTKYVTMSITENMFNHTTELKLLGYINEVDFGSNYKTATFSGDGLIKSIGDTTFPYGIVSRLSKLERFNGLFSGITFPDNIILPGDMFKSNPNLNNVSGAFYNLNASITLTSNGFENCPNLTDISHMFDSENNLKTIDSIPNRLFYHGQTTKTNIIKGCYTEDITYDEESQIVYPEEPTQLPVTYISYNNKISNAEYCFKRSDVGVYNLNDNYPTVENNPNYNPFDYIYLNGYWTKNNAKDTRQYQFYWEYDGAKEIDSIIEHYNSINGTSLTRDNFVLPDEIEVESVDSNYKPYNGSDIKTTLGNKEDSYNFCCSPDLLRYCTIDCSVTGLFQNCGKLGLWVYNSGSDEYKEILSSGLKGRICPYLLKPVSNITILDEFMSHCKGLSSYKNLEGDVYLIPKTFFSYVPKVYSLKETFLGLIFTQDCKLDLFNTLKSNLNIEKIFFGCYFPSTVESVFSNNNVSRTRAAFAVNINPQGEADKTPRPYAQDIQFRSVFKDYTNKQGDENYQLTFNGYLKAIHEDPKTLSDLESDYNYQTYS